MRSQSLRIFLTDFNTNYIIIYLMPSRDDGSFLRYHETGVRADQLCAAGRPDPETFLNLPFKITHFFKFGTQAFQIFSQKCQCPLGLMTHFYGTTSKT